MERRPDRLQGAGAGIPPDPKLLAGRALHELDEYWASLHEPFFALTVYLDDERWLDEPITPAARSHGESWIVVDGTQQEQEWLQPVTSPQQAAQSSAGRPAGGGTRTISYSLRFQVLRRDDFACVYCGSRAPDIVLRVDHVIPWSAGGTTTLDNLRSACSDCNLGKGATRLTPLGSRPGQRSS